MALFTDGPPSDIDDLTGQDSQLLSVANVENIDVTRKLALTYEELALDLTAQLMGLTLPDLNYWVFAPPRLHNLVVTPALKLWHEFRALEAVYRDAYNSQLNDRYAGKRDQFHEMARWAYEKLIQTGLGIVLNPVPRAATPTVISAPGALRGGTYYVATAWLNQAGEEGASAIPASLEVSGSTLLVSPGVAPALAVKWNVYAGTDPYTMVLQNTAPLGTGQTWLQPGTLTTSGRAPGRGQSPNYVQPVPRKIQRG